MAKKKIEEQPATIMDGTTEGELKAALRKDGGLVLARGTMKYGGVIYAAGDVVPLGGGLHDEKLLRLGWFISKARWRAMHDLTAARKFHRDTLSPVKAAAQGAMTEETKAEAQLLAAERELATAREKAEIARARRQKAEQELETTLEQAPDKS